MDTKKTMLLDYLGNYYKELLNKCELSLFGPHKPQVFVVYRQITQLQAFFVVC